VAAPENAQGPEPPPPDARGPDTRATRALLQALGYEPVDLDTLALRTGLPGAELAARLLELELDGRVSRMPGGLFQRCGRA
jgi:DNA processing protein